MALEHHNGRGEIYRVNPRDKVTVEKKLPSGRWQVVKRCDSRDSAIAYLFRLAGRPQQQRR